MKKDKKHKKSADVDDGGSRSSSEGESRSSSEGSDSESSEDSEDEPIYQLRQRRSTAQNYRFNDYDQMIESAIQVRFIFRWMIGWYRSVSGEMVAFAFMHTL